MVPLLPPVSVNAPLDEEIFLELPTGYKKKTEGDVVLKLLKSLYGLKQSGRNWPLLIDGWMKKYGLEPSLKDPCLYTLDTPSGKIIVCLYVDDMLTCDDTGDPSYCNKFIADITNEYKMAVTDDIDSYLSAKLVRTADGITVTMTKNILELLERTGLLNCKPVPTPMTEGLTLAPAASPLAPDQVTEFRSIV
jgi:histone deacetylase 1/2